MIVKVVFVVSFFVSSTLANWQRHLILDPNEKYHLYWKVENEEIVFKTEVATTGYIGFGISPNGGMKGSDLVIGWVKDGMVMLHDRHATGNTPPPIDDHQDWFLLYGHENNTHTTLVFYRKLVTCDEQDRPITDDTMRVIYSWGEKDPESFHKVHYHGAEGRGSRSVLMLQPEVPPINTEKYKVWEVRAPNTTVPHEYDTTYWCTFHKAPVLQEKMQVIIMSPYIQKGHELLVHHAILYECQGVTSDEMEPLLSDPGHDCSRYRGPPQRRNCQSVFYVYAVGTQPLVLPEYIGFPIGEVKDKYFMLEMHYDNPMMKPGYVDASGMNFYYTSELRKHDAGIIMSGVQLHSKFIPPGQKEFIVNGHCSSECTTKSVPMSGVRVHAVGLHTHLLGRKIAARHFRGETELPTLAKDSNYDFNFQEYTVLKEERQLLPGDQITVECFYDSTDRNETSFGGLTTRDEMCLAFLVYYPKSSISVCLSAPTTSLWAGASGVNIVNEEIISPEFAIKDGVKNFRNYIKQFDWVDENYVKAINYVGRYGPHDHFCTNNFGAPFRMTSHARYPANLKPYVEPNICENK